MYLTGYHGTTLAHANKILTEHKFYTSRSDHEWLADGIYFYYNIEDALNWRDNEVIIHSLIKIKDTEFFDMYSDRGKELFFKVYNKIASMQEENGNKKNYSAHQNQCAIMRAIWNLLPNAKVIAASLPPIPSRIPVIFDARPKRREFCVRSNDYIKYMHLIKRGEIND